MGYKIVFGVLLVSGVWAFAPLEREAEAPVAGTVTIGSQEWMTQNLDVSHFRNGDAIFEANTYEKWEYAAIKGLPAWCYYNNNPEYGKQYGKLYNGWAIRDERGLGPEGWHVPDEKEWAQLAEDLGGAEAAGAKLSATDGFSALPGGYRTHEMPKYYGGPFYEAGESGYWWTATGYVVDNIWTRSFSPGKASLDKISFDRTAGMYVRLVRDKAKQ